MAARRLRPAGDPRRARWRARGSVRRRRASRRACAGNLGPGAAPAVTGNPWII